ncbi:hypothetical protein Nocox_01350 [Nonomuraea coxensis DSM 45129]|uniref:DUF3558 domain-containing protein n=1 Tax=Nonomuraea coxensis DSM 45129 TaxID=1122611 RepID=A0ABX8TTL9_9ACTN|nr:hypothetical protein [Nonomuraea coxensis]QYC37904.1 hypothetical protein Nocox_01350 [Nonomuraea coxensis DSM 45129]
MLCATAAATLITGCTPDNPATSPSPHLNPARGSVADRAPYLCYFIPQSAVADVTGYNGPYDTGDEKRDPDGYSCVISNDEQSIFITRYDVSAPSRVIENFLEFGKESNLVKLPEKLGKGGISDFDIRLYPYRRASAWFRCGSNNSLIAITVKRNPARDQDHDLIQLMEIAQRRFAEMFKCEPGGPPQG